MEIRIKIPDELHWALKEEAAKRKVPLRELVIERLSLKYDVSAAQPVYGGDYSRDTIEVIPTGENVGDGETAKPTPPTRRFRNPDEKFQDSIRRNRRGKGLIEGR